MSNKKSAPPSHPAVPASDPEGACMCTHSRYTHEPGLFWSSCRDCSCRMFVDGIPALAEWWGYA